MSEYRTERKQTDQVVHFWTAQCHRRTCDIHNSGQKLKKKKKKKEEGKKEEIKKEEFCSGLHLNRQV